MQIAILNEIPKDEKLANKWDDLVSQMEQPEVFFTYEWALAVSLSFSESIRPFLILVADKDNGKLIGVAALAVRHGKDDQIFFLADKTADYCDFISNPGDRHKIVDAVFGELKQTGRSKFVMANFPEISTTNRSIKDIARKHGFYMVSQEETICPQVNFEVNPRRTELKMSLDQKKKIRRYFNALSKMGALDIVHTKNLEEITSELQNIIHAHIVRFFSSGRVSPFINEERRRFLSNVSKILTDKGWFVLSKLSLNKKALAWNIGFQFSGKWFWYMPTYEIGFEKESPGSVLLKDVLERAIDMSDIHIVDLGLGDEFYKSRFANTAQKILQITFTDSRINYSQVLLKTIIVKNLKRFPSADIYVRKSINFAFTAYRRMQEKGIWYLFKKLLSNVVHFFWNCEKLVFFKWEMPKQIEQNTENCPFPILKPIDGLMLAEAALHFATDKEALLYLTRSGERLRKGIQGFVLIKEDTIPVHFCWVSDFKGFFISELQTVLDPPEENAMVIFDCWTPALFRGLGFYPRAIRLIASQFYNTGKTVWIFSAVKNIASIKGIKKAGFNMRFLVASRGIFFWRKLNKYKENN